MSTEAAEKNYGLALYHPHIHIRNVDWLKSALLYWDGIRRIVPDKFPEDNVDRDLDPEVRELISRRKDLLPRTLPTKYVDRAMTRFLDCAHRFDAPSESTLDQSQNPVLDLVQQAYQRITGSQGMTELGLKELLNDLLKDSKDMREIDMWDSKMRNELMVLLKEAGLLRVDPKTGYVWVKKLAADLYMICLATVMSEAIGSPPITYRPDYADVGKYADFGSTQQTGDGRVGMLLNLELPFPAPEELHEIPLLKILDIHDETETERRGFRTAVEDLLREGARAKEDEYRYQDFLADRKKQLAQEFERHKAKMESLKVKGVGSFLKITVPTALVGLVSQIANAVGVPLDPPATGALAVAGMTLSGVMWRGEVRQQRREAEESFPYHYLLTLEKEYGLPTKFQQKR